MKKAYVKPVFFAEEYLVEASIAACTKASIYEALELKRGDTTLCNQNCGHVIGKGSNYHIDDYYTHDDVAVPEDGTVPAVNTNTYWQYAQAEDSKITLFNTNNYECEFLWSYEDTGLKNEISVWGSTSKSERPNNGIFGTGFSLVNFFLGNSTSHNLGYDGASFLS